MRSKIVLPVFILLFSNNLHAQILAGQDTGQVYFYDFVPDTSLSNLSGHYGTGYCNLDLTGDLIDDFQLKVKYEHAPGFNQYTWYLKCLNNNQVVITPVGFADTIPYQTLIDNNSMWSATDSLSLGRYSYHNISQFTFYTGPWSDSTFTDSYLGVRMFNLGDTIYGFIHVCRCISSPNLLIKDYGKEITNVEISEIASDYTFEIRPNPTLDKFFMTSTRIIQKGTVQIFNASGIGVYSESIFNSSEKEINLKNISSGIYFVKVFDGKRSYCKKLIVE